MELIHLLVVLLIVGLILAIVWWAIEQVPVIEPFRWAVRLVFALIVALVLIDLLLSGIPLRIAPLRI